MSTGRWVYLDERSIVVAPYWLGWGCLTGGIVEDYGLEPNDHLEVMDEIDQAVGEVIVDTILDILDEHADDPRIAAALRWARGEAAA